MSAGDSAATRRAARLEPCLDRTQPGDKQMPDPSVYTGAPYGAREASSPDRSRSAGVHVGGWERRRWRPHGRRFLGRTPWSDRRRLSLRRPCTTRRFGTSPTGPSPDSLRDGSSVHVSWSSARLRSREARLVPGGTDILTDCVLSCLIRGRRRIVVLVLDLLTLSHSGRRAFGLGSGSACPNVPVSVPKSWSTLTEWASMVWPLRGAPLTVLLIELDDDYERDADDFAQDLTTMSLTTSRRTTTRTTIKTDRSK